MMDIDTSDDGRSETSDKDWPEKRPGDDSSVRDSWEPGSVAKLDHIIAADDDSEGALTFGVELEFLLPMLPASWGGEDPEEDKREHAGREIFCDSFDSDHYGGEFGNDEDEVGTEWSLDMWLLDRLRDGSPGVEFRHASLDRFYPPHNNVRSYEVWRLSSESTVRRDPDARWTPYKWTGREITSRIMEDGGCDASRAEIGGVCRSLQRTRACINETASVHVHVGRGDDTFSLLTMKKFATLFWLTEHHLLSLHKPSRHSNPWCCAVTKFSHLARQIAPGPDQPASNEMRNHVGWKGDFGPDCSETWWYIRQIWEALDVESLAEMLNCQAENSAIHRGSVEFSKFLPAGKTGGNTHTFEFRQMAGSLDPDLILSWVNVCLRFTDFARTSSASTFKALIQEVVRRGKGFAACDLLEWLGLQEAGFFGGDVDEDDDDEDKGGDEENEDGDDDEVDGEIEFQVSSQYG